MKKQQSDRMQIYASLSVCKTQKSKEDEVLKRFYRQVLKGFGHQ